jgi:hypothetical protein
MGRDIAIATLLMLNSVAVLLGILLLVARAVRETPEAA